MGKKGQLRGSFIVNSALRIIARRRRKNLRHLFLCIAGALSGVEEYALKDFLLQIHHNNVFILLIFKL